MSVTPLCLFMLQNFMFQSSMLSFSTFSCSCSCFIFLFLFIGKAHLTKDKEHFKNRFSVYRICDFLPSLVDEQKQCVREAGFGALLSLAEFSIAVKLVKWIMKYMDIGTRLLYSTATLSTRFLVWKKAKDP